MKSSMEDEKWMKRALFLAEKGRGRVSPNPMVGCVIVKNGRLLAEGWHKKFGGPHAEIETLRKIKNPSSLLHGATLYVNLEPCVHFGKTPPCVPEIIRAKLRRVVIGMKDPNPLVFGKGIRALGKAGVRTEIGCLEKEAKVLNRIFIKNMRTALPYVALKIAMSLDGKIATKTGESKWITSISSRRLVGKIRSLHDAILVGKNTVLQDDPRLSASNKPVRIILDSSFEIPLNASVFRNSRAVLITTSSAPIKKIYALQKKGITVKIFPGKIRLAPLLGWLLKEKRIASILVEGGSEVFGSFIDKKFADYVYCFIAPKIIGGMKAKAAIGGVGISRLKDALSLSQMRLQRINQDIFIEAGIKSC